MCEVGRIIVNYSFTGAIKVVICTHTNEILIKGNAMKAQAIETNIKMVNASLKIAKDSTKQLVNSYGRETCGFSAVISDKIEDAISQRTKRGFISLMKEALVMQKNQDAGVIII